MNPRSNGIPQTLFKTCVGVILIQTVEVGLVVSGTVGSGILLKREDGNKWSLPTACGLGGIGWGLLVGASVKDLIVFIMDETKMNAIAFDKIGLKVGGQVETTLGPLGRSANMDMTVSKKGVGSTISFAYSKGAFLGMSIEGAIVGARHAVNKKFYGKEVTAKDIFEGKVELPADKVTLLNDVYDQLEKLSSGTSAAPENEEKKQAAAAIAHQASAELNEELAADISYVDAEVEAAKERA